MTIKVVAEEKQCFSESIREIDLIPQYNLDWQYILGKATLLAGRKEASTKGSYQPINFCKVKFKIVGKTGLRVSEVCLGTMTFGEDWGWGASKDTCREIVKTYLDAGDNFIDTANYYTNGSSEAIVRELLEGIRDKIVLATKYSLMTDPTNINSGGNHRKNMIYSVEQSLKRLKTDYIDIYWVHIWDRFTPVEEVIRALEDLVRTGKILHTGISDTPAWVVAKANALAQERDWTGFSAIQAEYNLLERSAERELIPMADEEKLSVLEYAGDVEPGVTAQ